MLLLSFAGKTFAASDGSVGATSAGTSAVSVWIGKLIIVRDMNDFAFGTYSGAGNLAMNDDINVASNFPGTTYQVTITGDGSGSAFTISDGPNTIPYDVYYNDDPGLVGRVAVTSGVDLVNQDNAEDILAALTLNANLSIEMSQANLQTAVANTYTGTITLLFQPEQQNLRHIEYLDV